MWFWYVPQYINADYNKDAQNQLYVGEQHRDVFYDRNLERLSTCWTLRKSQDEINPNNYIHPSDSVFIPYHAASHLHELALLFNQSSTFYCYDNYTYLTIQALMCGADSVVIPHKYTKDVFLNGAELNRYVAFGLDDLPRAKSVRNEFQDHLNSIEIKTISQIHEFAQKCHDRFK